MQRIIALWFAAATALGANVAHAQARVTPEQHYLAAREAYAKGNVAVLATHARGLKGHILEPYAEFWQLRLRLEQAAPGEVSDFLGRHVGTLVAEPWADYGLVDSGHGRKLERYGQYRFIRPEVQAACRPPWGHQSWRNQNHR